MSDYTYDAQVLNVVDGDTVDVSLDLGFDVHMTHRLRLHGINAPELHSKNPAEKAAGQKAQEALKGLLAKDPAHSAPVIVETIQDKAEKFGRFLARIKVGTIDVNAEMIRLGHAKPYDGGKRQPWPV